MASSVDFYQKVSLESVNVREATEKKLSVTFKFLLIYICKIDIIFQNNTKKNWNIYKNTNLTNNLFL